MIHRSALSKFKSIAAIKAAFAPPPCADQRARVAFDRLIEGLRKAGVPEEGGLGDFPPKRGDSVSIDSA